MSKRGADWLRVEKELAARIKASVDQQAGRRFPDTDRKVKKDKKTKDK